MEIWLFQNVGLIVGLVVSALGAAFTLRGEIKRNREVMQDLKAWIKAHDATLTNHGDRIARVEGVLGGDHWMRQPYRPASKQEG